MFLTVTLIVSIFNSMPIPPLGHVWVCRMSIFHISLGRLVMKIGANILGNNIFRHRNKNLYSIDILFPILNLFPIFFFFISFSRILIRLTNPS